MASVFPEVSVVIVTYNRYKEIQATVSALRQRMEYPADKLRWLVADDGSPASVTARLRKLASFEGAEFVSGPNVGWGANVNRALAKVETDYVFQIEDDYVLSEGRTLDLRAGVALLESKPDVGMLRYRGTAGTHVVLHQFEADVSPWLPDVVEGEGVPGKLSYLQLDSGSHSLYLYSHGPHLKRRGFHAFYGSYPENLRLGETEEAMAHQVKDKMKLPGAPAITILPEWIALRWQHIGKSYQGTEADRARTT